MNREVSVPVATVWTSPEAPRDVDEAAVRDLPDAHAWADSMDQEARLGLHGRTETQLLMGEPVEVLDERDGWSHVVALVAGVLPRRRAATPAGCAARTSATPVGRDGPSPTPPWSAPRRPARVDGDPVELSFGTVLRVASLGEETADLHLPGGRTGEVPLDGLRLGRRATGPPVPGPDDVLAAARQFLGVRYLWGGTSGWGLDCSGLVHLTLRSVSACRSPATPTTRPSATWRTSPLDDVRPGDLYFFARPGERIYHVGFVTRPVAADGTRWMLHAPEGGELIEDAPLARHRVEHLVAAGRVAAAVDR